MGGERRRGTQGRGPGPSKTAQFEKEEDGVKGAASGLAKTNPKASSQFSFVLSVVIETAKPATAQILIPDHSTAVAAPLLVGHVELALKASGC